MNHDVFVIVYLLLMGAIIIGVDVLFLRNHVWWRLGVNIGIVAVFAIVYLVFLRGSFMQ